MLLGKSVRLCVADAVSQEERSLCVRRNARRELATVAMCERLHPEYININNITF